MNLLAQLREFHRVRRALSYDDEQLRRVQGERLRALVVHAYASVPYYRQRLDELGVTPDAVRGVEDLAKLPILARAELQAADPDALISERWRRTRLAREQTSGSSGRPFVMHLDEPYRRMRKALFLRALMDCGYRPGRRLLIVTTRERRGVPTWLGWRYLSYSDPPRQNVDEHNRRRPHVLYGWVTPIRQMAETARAAGLRLHAPRAVITTAETLDPATRQLLTQTFNCPVCEIYGLTETGTIAWQSPGHEHFRVSHESMIVEFLPPRDADGDEHEVGAAGTARRVVVTNLGLWSMPLIRYDTGDLATPAYTAIPATPAYTARPGASSVALPAIERIDGRQVDCVRVGEGRVVSPFELTMAMEKVPGVVRYQIVQDAPEHVTVRYEAHAGSAASAAATVPAAARAMRDVLGPRVRVDVRREASLDPAPGSKFRVVQSRMREQGVTS
ncbi:MAG: hypothetical protein WD009_07260 [Phycisphaeraceae bacterium]